MWVNAGKSWINAGKVGKWVRIRVKMCEICVDLGEMVIKWRQIQEAGKAGKAEAVVD